MSPVPAVSVLLAVHNGAAFVEEAVRSIMVQTLQDIEILLVDDASSDQTPNLLKKLALEDTRISVITLSENKRLPGALNEGLRVARAPLIARMDADDISHPTRLEVQKAWMDANPDIVALGTSFRRITADGRPLRTTIAPWTASQARWRSRFRVPFQHPTAMFQRLPAGQAIFYDPSFTVSEDTDFFARMLEFGEVACLPDVLLDYREHGANTTMTKWHEQIAQSDSVRRNLIARELPAEVAAGLNPVLDAFAGQKRIPPREIFAGLRQMLDYDLKNSTEDAQFLRRQTAFLAYQTLRRSGQPNWAAALAFLCFGIRMIPSLVTRYMEIKGLIGPEHNK